jgi:DNA-binding LacI/PurR family transcriptional regulator
LIRLRETVIKRRATIIEVAERANVAFSTVSRVLNGGYASADARHRVEKAARELGYSPSPAARNLKMGRQGSVGVVVESSQGPWFMQVLAGIEEALEERAIGLMLCSLALRGRYDDAAVRRWIAEQRVDGVVFARCTRREEPLVKLAKRERLPMVFIAPDEHFGAGPVFATRNREANAEVAEHLVALGHRHFAFVGGPKDSVDTGDRLCGLRDGLAAHDLEIKAADVRYGPSYGSEGGEDYAAAWFARPRAQAPTAVVCGNDTIALGFLRGVLQRGVRVPDDVSVTGFDGAPEAGLYWPGLTTVRQPSAAMGDAACKALLRMIDNPGVSDTTRLDLPAPMIARESTGPAPHAKPRAVRASRG